VFDLCVRRRPGRDVQLGCKRQPEICNLALKIRDALRFLRYFLPEFVPRRREPFVVLGQARCLGRRKFEFGPTRAVVVLWISWRSFGSNDCRRPPCVNKADGRRADRRRLTGARSESHGKPIFRLQQPAMLGRERLGHSRRHDNSLRYEDRTERLARRFLLLESERKLLVCDHAVLDKQGPERRLHVSAV
jgi:hypothetical protein